MQGRHPLTGKPIRIMRTETHLYRDDKTLCWLRDQPYLPKFRRWDSIVTDANALEIWTKVLSMPPMVFASISNDTTEIKTLLDGKLLDGVQIIFLRKEPLMAYGKAKLEAKGYQNIICIEEMERMYPNTFYKFVAEHQNTLSDLVLAIGALFKHHRIVGFYDYELSPDYRALLNTTYNIITGLSSEQPKDLWLIQQWFQSSKAKRDRELKKCLLKNLENPYIDRIVLLNEEDYSKTLPTHEKLQQKSIGHRMTYWDVMQEIQTACPPDTLIAFANTDIYFDETVRQLWSVRMEDRFLSLLRWDEQNDPTQAPILFGPRPDSQDTWILLSTSLQQRTLSKSDYDFEFGRAGCDNAVNLSMLKNKFIVCNPAYSLKTYHVHQSGLRTYDPKDCIDKPMYLYVEPTGLHDMSPQKDLKSYERPWQQPTPFTRPIKGDRQQVRTLCTMLAREEVFHYDPDEENRWYPTNKEKDTIYEIPNCITTTNGLVYDFNKIYLGGYEAYVKEWSSYELSQLVPCLSVSSVASTLCPDEVVKNPFTFITQYLAKIISMREQGYKGEFWVPREATKILREFQWDDEQIPILPRDPNIQVFGKKTYILPPVKTPGSTKESIEVLRKTLRAYQHTPSSTTKVAILFQDDELLDILATTTLEKMLQGLGYTTHVLYPKTAEFSHTLAHMCGASLLIAPLTKKTQSHHLYWLLPKSAQVIELQKELEPLGEGIHEAGAASLDYWFASVPRGKNMHTLIAERVYAIFSMQLSLSTTQPQKPVLILPSQPQEGIHFHSNDSFREIATLWEKKGYISLKKDNATPFCWLNDTLLYDRPTYKWLDDAQPIFKKALVGNPEPRDTSRMKSWTFWPRRPELVEALVKEGIQNQKRTKSIVFYGKCENATQTERRSRHDWFSACDEWQMAKADEPYTLSQEDYLRRIAEAKYGLCLPGYGLKCHREIECMAFGTVPICTPEVDMKNYANPPVEGVHYFCVSSPSEARAIADTTSQEQWTAMSKACQQWWCENASVEGMWLLTKTLALE